MVEVDVAQLLTEILARRKALNREEGFASGGVGSFEGILFWQFDRAIECSLRLSCRTPQRRNRMRTLERKNWIETRTAVAEALLQAHVASPDASAEDLRNDIGCDNGIFNAALSHLIAKGRLPRNIYTHVKAAENRARILSVLSQCGGCTTDDDWVRQLFNADDLKAFWRIIDDLVDAKAIRRTHERILVLPDERCVTSVAEELPAPKVAIEDIERIIAVGRYANFVGVAIGDAAQIFADLLEQQGRIIAVAKRQYRTRITVEKAVRRIRAAFQEYREYWLQEVSTNSGTDEHILRHVLARLERDGEVRSSTHNKFKPTDSFSGRGWPCSECATPTNSIEFFYDTPLCLGCRLRLSDKYGCITKTRALKEFRLREHELYRLSYIERPNPHYRRGSPMHLFLLSQVQELARTKWGSDEPYYISLTDVSPEQLRWFDEDPERLKQLSPERFQLLLADRLEAMGLCVQLVGRANRPDGGIDLIAYPDPRSVQPKYLLAVQAEHHRSDRRTGAPKVQKFAGAMLAVPEFRLGFLVTNTTFTWNAAEYAKTQSHFLRLRGLSHLRKWLRDDFNNDAEWQEFPEFVQCGAFRVPILTPTPPNLLYHG
jgi:hypothetical protein